ncbi:MAG: hypothetical protein WAL71_00335, partial [Terriglobales bacterium]
MRMVFLSWFVLRSPILMPLPGTVDETGQNFPKKPPNVFLGFCYAITNLGRPPELEHTINIPNMRDSHYAL